jgi:two-component system chemotaxis sensor kinase CheA
MNEEMKEILNDFLAESSEMLEALDQHFVKLETEPSNAELLNEIFRCMHSMKGSAGFLGFTHLVEVAHQAESLLNKLRQGEMSVSPFIIDIILEAVDAVKMLQSDIRKTGEDSHVDTRLIINKLALTMDSADDLKVSIPSPSKMVTEAVVSDRPPSPIEMKSSSLGVAIENPPVPGLAEDLSVKEPAMMGGAAALAEPAALSEGTQGLSEVLHKMKEAASRTVKIANSPEGKSTGGKEEGRTVRVETKRLDEVMNLVGELVLARNRLMKLGLGLEEQYETNPLVRELGPTLGQLNLVTSDLQLAVMKTRMVPIQKVFSRFPRLVRDFASKLGKQVRLELVGEDTEVDKSVADELSDPLVHLIRNAIDHGLETVADRQRNGKGPEGYVRLSAQQEGNSIVIRVEDNGRGLQVEKIAEKAMAKGLVVQADLDTMSPRDIINLIFLPGFSTAEQVSDVSGRGVGLDVVRTNISRMNGTLELDSEPGHGSRVMIKLPLTVAIIQALMVEVECATFAIPLASVVEAVKVTKEDIEILNGRPVLNFRERILPLLDLGATFQIPNSRSGGECYVVVVTIGQQQFGVVVDRLGAQEEVVIKSLGEFLSNVKGVAGATITGDGRVVLIMDMSDLMNELHTSTYAGIR